MRVRNLQGFEYPDGECKNCGPWMNHWMNCTGLQADRCYCVNRDHTVDYELQGGHVIEVDEDDNDIGDIMIIPLCPNHNNPNFLEPFEVQFLCLAVTLNCCERN